LGKNKKRGWKRKKNLFGCCINRGGKRKKELVGRRGGGRREKLGERREKRGRRKGKEGRK